MSENTSMNDLNTRFLNTTALTDVQGRADLPALAIERVGIRGIKHLIHVQSGSGSFPTVAQFEMDVALPADPKGIHI